MTQRTRSGVTPGGRPYLAIRTGSGRLMTYIAADTADYFRVSYADRSVTQRFDTRNCEWSGIEHGDLLAEP